jgi:hypothetical protein
MLITFDPYGGLPRPKRQSCRLAYGASELIITWACLMKLFWGVFCPSLSQIVSPFQNKRGWTRGQKLVHPRGLVIMSVRLNFYSTWRRKTICSNAFTYTMVVEGVVAFVESRMWNSGESNDTIIISKHPRRNIKRYTHHAKSIT